MTITTYKLTTALLSDAPQSSVTRFCRGDLVLCAFRDGTVSLIGAVIVPHVGDIGGMPICRVVEPVETLAEAFAPWRDVSINVHEQGVAFCYRDPQGGICDDWTASCEVPLELCDPLAIRGVLLEYAGEFPGAAAVALRPWEPRAAELLPTDVPHPRWEGSAVMWEFETEEEGA